MKNIMLGIIGIFVVLYTLQIGLNVLFFQTQKNELEKHVSRVVKNTLEADFSEEEEASVKQMILEELKETLSDDRGELEVEVQGIDLQKGFLSVRVTKRVEMLNGKERTIVVEKTAIVDRLYISNVGNRHWLDDVESRYHTSRCV